jgi:uncharacterized YigZ family protein
MADTFKTIDKAGNGIYKEKGSKFLSFAIPVTSIEEVKGIIQEYKKTYFDARHVCYAYMLGANREEFRANDDGEPSGTAGKPILGQINSNELTNILIIVVRYFGGVLLGTGGLITAYKEAAADALNNCNVIEKIVKTEITLRFDYLLMNDIMGFCKLMNAEITSQTFDNECEIELLIPKSETVMAKSRLEKMLIHSTFHVHIG